MVAGLLTECRIIIEEVNHGRTKAKVKQQTPPIIIASIATR